MSSASPTTGARAFACLEDARRDGTPGLEEVIESEQARGLLTAAAFRRFAVGVRERVSRLDSLLEQNVGAGQKIAAYGAAGRATIFFNGSRAAGREVRYVVVESPERTGRLMPGYP